MIKNIVFDVGKVLIDWYPFETMEQLGFSKDVMDTIRKYIFDSGEWSREDEGLMTRDPRAVERKKCGQPKARKKFQFSKR